MRQLTSIDGTVVLDTSGSCHAIGAILDGMASHCGDRARGGRYNSAVMYMGSAPAASLIVVISHEGTIDFVSRAAVRRDP